MVAREDEKVGQLPGISVAPPPLASMPPTWQLAWPPRQREHSRHSDTKGTSMPRRADRAGPAAPHVTPAFPCILQRVQHCTPSGTIPQQLLQRLGRAQMAS